MYEVAKHFYMNFLPEVVEAAAKKGPEMELKYDRMVQNLLAGEEHVWKKGLTPEEAERLREEYEQRYGR